jgi:hypothetical protein
MIFSRKEKRMAHAVDAKGKLMDPATRLPMERKRTPGYYPGYHVVRQQKFWDAATRKLILDRISTSPPIRFFTPTEAATMEAVVGRILPQDDRTGDAKIPILPRIDERLFLNRIEGYRYEDMPSDQEAYRIAAHAFESMAQEVHGKSFDVLTTMDQEKILKSIHDNDPIAAHKEWASLNVKRFWAMLVSDCCTVYYAHPSAWDEIGFGGPAYPRGYMRLEEGEAETWEVEERRYAWLAPGDTLSDETGTLNGKISHSRRKGTE